MSYENVHIINCADDYDVEVLHHSPQHKWVEIWQDGDIVEFEVELIPKIVEALLDVHSKRL